MLSPIIWIVCGNLLHVEVIGFAIKVIGQDSDLSLPLYFAVMKVSFSFHHKPVICSGVSHPIIVLGWYRFNGWA